MGWFSNITDFLSSPAFRIASGVAGLASGAGAFGDTSSGWGQALSGLAGAANVASGAASTFGPNRSALDRATGALQLGLGGYNIGQSAGAVGSFGDVWNQINGSSGGSTGNGIDTSVTRGGELAPLPTASGGASSSLENTSPLTAPPQVGYVPPGTTTSASDTQDLGWGDRAEAPRAGTAPPSPAGQPAMFPRTPAPAPDLAPAPAPAPPGSLDVTPQPGPVHPVPSATVTPTPTPAGTPPTPTPPVDLRWGQGGPTTSPIQAVSPTVLNQSDWLDRTWNNLLTAAERNPVGAAMQALQIGGMLTGLFAQSKTDIANDALARMDPNSTDGTEFRRLFEERARKEIEDNAATVRSGLEAKFAARGMLRSTVYTNAVQSLETARIKLLTDLPLTSLNAWNATPQGSGRALSSAASYAQATATPMDFSSMTRVLGQSPFTQQLVSPSPPPPPPPPIPPAPLQPQT